MPSLTARTPGKYNPGMTAEGAFSQQPPEKRPKDGDEDDQSFFGRPYIINCNTRYYLLEQFFTVATELCSFALFVADF